MIVKVLQRLVAARMVDFNITPNAASSEMDQFLRDLRLFLVKMILLFINQPPRSEINIVKIR
jgi:hypothetical protein